MRITEELLRRKAEHNEGMLSSLEEIALHQLGITRLENFDNYCRHIQIILLQNNLIERLENLSKLKELKYINLTLNNISIIENLEGCESLEKLDLTCNFIDASSLLESAANLRKCSSLREVYLTGNPCTDFEAWREIVIAIADQITTLDGREVLPSERILAKQNFEKNSALLEIHIEKMKEKLAKMTSEEKSNAYSIEYRKKIYSETAKDGDQKGETKQETSKNSKQINKFLSSGEMRQCNEGKYEFLLSEYDDPKFIVFSIKLPRFMDSSLIKVDIFPFFISLVVKDKLTQIKLWEEVRTTPLELKRSSTTGELFIKLEKCRFDEVIARQRAQQIINNSASLQKSKEVKAKQEDKNKSEDEIPDLE